MVRGKKYLYVKIWNEITYDYSTRKSIRAIKDELGSRGNRFPHTSKAGADALVQLWLRDRPVQKVESETLLSYLSSFWTEESDYIRGKGLRGKSYSKEYLAINHSAITNRFTDFLTKTGASGLEMKDVKADVLESFINYLSDLEDNLSNRRINQILQAVTVPLAEAFRRGLIPIDPGKVVEKLPEGKSVREILTPEEVEAFFSVPQTDPRFYVLNLLAVTTGMRLGECRGLLFDDIKNGEIEVCHNWQDKEGLKEPKWGSNRRVPIPEETIVALESLKKANPYGGPFVFWGNDNKSPISKWHVDKNFKETLCSIHGMTEQIRIKRGISFHAWRHYYNTELRPDLPDHVLRKLTGHSSAAMTDRYTSITEEQRMAVAKLSGKIFRKNN